MKDVVVAIAAIHTRPQWWRLVGVASLCGLGAAAVIVAEVLSPVQGCGATLPGHQGHRVIITALVVALWVWLSAFGFMAGLRSRWGLALAVAFTLVITYLTLAALWPHDGLLADLGCGPRHPPLWPKWIPL